MMKLLLLCSMFAYQVICEECQDGEKVRLQKGLKMRCVAGKWTPVQRRAGPKGPPCEDDPALEANGTCSANQESCRQFTVKGAEMDRDCAGTCNSCDGCRCQDNHQWHQYCHFWAQYCSNQGVLGNWMTTNCRKTCGHCKCPCCSYQGKQHALGARILLPEKCGELICEEGLVAGTSPLLSGAAQHRVSHPEELTLNFRAVHAGADCCVLPGDARSGDGSSVKNGTMVEEGWTGSIVMPEGSILATCCHGSLGVALKDVGGFLTKTRSTKTTPSTTTTPTTSTGDPACLEVKIDLRGNDIGSIGSIGSWQECACQCKKKAGCTFFTWNSYNKGCYMKNGDSGRTYKVSDFSASVDCYNGCN